MIYTYEPHKPKLQNKWPNYNRKKNNHETKEPTIRKEKKWSWNLGAKNEIQPKYHETKEPIAKDKRRLKAKDPRMKN